MFWKLQENILEKSDINSLIDFIRTTDRFTQFDKVREFEEAWSKWQGSRYNIFVNSGSSANLLIIEIMKQLGGWRDGDDVIVPAVTWVTNISPVIQNGLKPVFVDVNLKDLSFNYDELAAKITSRTKAIFVTHLIGIPADLGKIKEIIGSRDIKILEDCCESHGAEIGGKKVGNLGVCGSFSFYWGHHMTTIEGGMISTDNEEIYRQSVLKRSHGLARELPRSYHEKYAKENPEIDFNFLFLTDGFNFRNTEFNAVLGLSQIKKLDEYIKIRKRNHDRFFEILDPFKNYFHLLSNSEGISPFCLPFLFVDENAKREFQARLGEEGIESRPVIGGNLLRQPFLKDFGDYREFKNAEFVHRNGFYIGNNQFVDDERLERLSDILKDFFS